MKTDLLVATIHRLWFMGMIDFEDVATGIIEEIFCCLEIAQKKRLHSYNVYGLITLNAKEKYLIYDVNKLGHVIKLLYIVIT